MIVENKFGRVDFDWKDYKNICLSFSGGADSTLLLWMCLKLLQEKPNSTLHTFTGVTPAKGLWKQFTSGDTFDRMLNQFPGVKSQVRERRIMYNDTQKELGEAQVKLTQDGTFDLRMYGLTANPPHDVMVAHDLLNKREEIRDQDTMKEPWFNCVHEPPQGPMYQPFINVDKRWIAQAFKDLDIMHYYNNTISCERLRETPDMANNEEPCKHCWWCREKKMAFDMYDGEYEG